MTEQPTTPALGSTTVVFGWIEEARVQQVLHASDGFQFLLAITLAGFGGSVAVAVALIAGALHPIGLYLLLCALLASTGLAGVMLTREFKHYRTVRGQLMAVTARVPVPVLLVTPGSPSFTVGGQGAGPLQPSGAPSQEPTADPAESGGSETAPGRAAESATSAAPDRSA